jgi:hypothetical protein
VRLAREGLKAPPVERGTCVIVQQLELSVEFANHSARQELVGVAIGQIVNNQKSIVYNMLALGSLVITLHNV